MTKNWLVGAVVVALATTLTPSLSDAKRIGGGKSIGMQRSTPDRSTPQTPPAQPVGPQSASPTAGVPATAGAAAAAPAAAAAKRSWMGPIAGLAAGLGIAALLSHFGLGEGFANLIMIALLVFAAVFVIRFLLRRFGAGAQGGELATSSAAAGQAAPTAWKPTQRSAEPAFEPAATPRMQPAAGSDAVSVTGVPLAPIGGAATVAAVTTPPATAAALVLPEGFDLPAFERIAKMIFIRLQAANDAGDLEDLRQFTTPEMFAATRLELQERGGVLQHTDVERVEAEVVDFSKEASRQVVSVRFQGLVREEQGASATGFDEIWHLVKPDDDSRAWAIAGIQQPQ
ncbi:MAG TPA: TIM44-like domain-containing protein [Rubrivivax sp.]